MADLLQWRTTLNIDFATDGIETHEELLAVITEALNKAAFPSRGQPHQRSTEPCPARQRTREDRMVRSINPNALIEIAQFIASGEADGEQIATGLQLDAFQYAFLVNEVRREIKQIYARRGKPVPEHLT